MYDQYVAPLLKALAPVWSVLAPYSPYIVALLFLWIFVRVAGSHVLEVLEAVFDEVRAVLVGPTLKQMNLIGTLLLFILVVLFILDGTLEFLFGGHVPPADHQLFEHALIAFCVFLFGVIFVISVALAR
jgi:hypothetical protein